MNDIEKEFVPYTESLALKELGFDEPCLGFFNGINISFQTLPNEIITHRNTFLTWKQYKMKGMIYPEPEDADVNPEYERLKWSIKVTAPTYSQAFRFFREKYNLNSYIRCDCSVNEIFGYDWTIHKIMGVGEEIFIRGYGRLYEECELNCLQKLIKLCKTK